MLRRLIVLLVGLPLLAAREPSVDSRSFDELLLQSEAIEDLEQIPQLKQTLWEKYRQAVLDDVSRQKEQSDKSIRYKDKTMRFSLAKKGQKPATGYPLFIALHGGGGTASSVNDSQWEAMKSYYLSSVNTGIYVATRGVTDTWNLHFVDESYPLYDRLIENLIAFEDVDPNRVYIMGFSAGGDGVYHIAPRMADRWAAANMSAGHHNGITFDNLYRLPFLIQVGQNDSAYNRNRVAVENSNELGRLQGLRGGYTHAVYVHQNGSHNSWRDNDASRRPQSILANPDGWLKGEASAGTPVNTNAIDWLVQYTRDSRTEKVYWDPLIQATERLVPSGAKYLADAAARAALSKPNRLFYWLDLGLHEGELPQGVIRAAYSRALNRMDLELPLALNHLRILLDPSMLDFQKEISVAVNKNELGTVLVKANLQTLARTLLERGDAQSAFSAEIVLENQDGVWRIRTAVL